MRPPGSLTGYCPITRAIPLRARPSWSASATARPTSAHTDGEGRYRIDGIPPGQYVPAAVAVGYEESAAARTGSACRAWSPSNPARPPRRRHRTQPAAVGALPEPAGRKRQPDADRRVYSDRSLPRGQRGPSAGASPSASTASSMIPCASTCRWTPNRTTEYPMLFVVYPGPTDNWEAISVAALRAGYAVVAAGPGSRPAPRHRRPCPGRAHRLQPGRATVRSVPASPAAAPSPWAAASAARFCVVSCCDEADNVAAWITLGGISDGYSLAPTTSTPGAITVPEMHNLAIPSLGLPNLYPLPFLRYSPSTPPVSCRRPWSSTPSRTKSRASSRRIMLEDALRAAGVPVEAYYYDDVSHYLQIGENHD